MKAQSIQYAGVTQKGFHTIGGAIAHNEERGQRTVELFRLPLTIGEHPRAKGGSEVVGASGFSQNLPFRTDDVLAIFSV